MKSTIIIGKNYQVSCHTLNNGILYGRGISFAERIGDLILGNPEIFEGGVEIESSRRLESYKKIKQKSQ